MSQLTPLYPRQLVPEVAVPVVGGDTWNLADQNPQNFTMIVFYRGFHCPICTKYLADLDGKLSDFTQRGVETIAISSDELERAAQSKSKWRLENLTIGYGLDLDVARQWGLYISTGRGKTSVGVEEPALFTEPGLFLVRPDRTLYCATVQTMPFARPNFSEIVMALDFVPKNDYPARGEVLDHHTISTAV